MSFISLRAACAAGISAVVVAGALAATATPALAAAAAVTPTTELRVDGAYGSPAFAQGQTFDVTGADVIATPGVNSLTVQNAVPQSVGSARIDIAGGTDNLLTAGQTYKTSSEAPAAGLVHVTVAAGSCSTSSGELSVLDVARDGGGVLTAFAGTLVFSCDGATANSAEVRWNSSVDHVAFGGVAANATSTAKTVTVTPVATTTFGTATFGASNADNPFFPFRTGADTCSGQTVATGSSCTIAVTAHPTDRGGNAGVLTLPTTSGDPASAVSLTAVGLDSKGGSYTSITPSRLVDTRTTGGPYTAGQTRSLQVTGKGGVPTTGVSAAVLNVTVVSPTRAGNVVVFPTGATRPTASTVNFNAGWTGASLTTVPVGTGGKVDITNATGSVNVIVDVVGYYRTDASTTAGAYGGYFFGTPFRIIDTRQPGQGPALPANEGISLAVDYNDASDPFDYNSHVKALAVNITAVGPTAAGHFTSWDGTGSSVPNTSTLNFVKGQTVPNMTIVPTQSCQEDWCTQGSPEFTVFNASKGSTHIIVDVAGYFDDNQTPGSLRFVPRTPTRIVDTRSGLGTTVLGPNATKTVVAPASVAGLNTWALVTGLTAAAPSANTAVIMWGNTGSRPTASNLNPSAGQYVSNMTISGLGAANDFNLYNGGKGTTNLIVDVLGSMEHYPTLVPLTAAKNVSSHKAAVQQEKTASPVARTTGSTVFGSAFSRTFSVG